LYSKYQTLNQNN